MKPRLLAAILPLLMLLLVGGGSPAWGIVNGGSAAFADYPFMVSLRLASTPDRHHCGGTLIAPNLVLTAGHCVRVEGTLSDLVAVVGVDTVGWEYAPRVEVVDMVYGPPLGATNVDDVAVLRLATDQLTPTVGLATTEPATGTKATALGWGSAGEPSPATLQLVTQKISKDDACAELMPFADAPTSLCAISLRSGTENGDSGGPLIVWDKKTAEPIQVGVLSIGNNDGKTYADSYQSVAVQADWIRQASSHLNQLRITEAMLPDADVGTAYTADLNEYVWSGTAPFTWGSLSATEPGWSLSSDGTLTGLPETPGFVTLRIQVSDALGSSAEAHFTLNAVQPIESTALVVGSLRLSFPRDQWSSVANGCGYPICETDGGAIDESTRASYSQPAVLNLLSTDLLAQQGFSCDPTVVGTGCFLSDPSNLTGVAPDITIGAKPPSWSSAFALGRTLSGYVWCVQSEGLCVMYTTYYPEPQLSLAARSVLAEAVWIN